VKLPPKNPAQTERDGQRDEVVRKEIRKGPDKLSPDSTKKAMRHGRDGVEHLEHGAYRENTLHYLGDLLVFGEEIWQLCSEGAEESQVEQTHHQTCDKGLKNPSVVED